MKQPDDSGINEGPFWLMVIITGLVVAAGIMILKIHYKL
jgi:hypothetical protein